MPVKKNSGLGRGLDAIFLENTLEKEEENKDVEKKESRPAAKTEENNLVIIRNE